ncbi:hypothetical protein EDB80DRAFT_874860 [Ilyonectria destructans]|nr:hypothetical protein EDB80DRAFT_874860 [Ilyonectria destructans]
MAMTMTQKFRALILSTHERLRERLGKALGHEVIAQFDYKQIETWEKDPKTG